MGTASLTAQKVFLTTTFPSPKKGALLSKVG